MEKDLSIVEILKKINKKISLTVIFFYSALCYGLTSIDRERDESLHNSTKKSIYKKMYLVKILSTKFKFV